MAGTKPDMEAPGASSGGPPGVAVRPLREDELGEADRIMRLAFGTFLGLPDPSAFMGDAGYVRTRWRADPDAALAAEIGGELVGSNFAANWGSFGFFGPLTVRPDLWDRGVARRLLERTMALFEQWGTRHTGLFTFPQSPKHVGLYQTFDFWPRFLTPVMSKAVGGAGSATGWSRYGEASEPERERALVACRELTGAIYDGLDLTAEVRAVEAQGLGETVLLDGGGRLDGFAVCHCGPGTEAGGGTCFVKFGAARPGPGAGEAFERLLDACEALAASRGLGRLAAGVNTARRDAYRRMLARGFRADLVGVAMQRPDEPGYNRPDVYVMDDWR
jgi:GNAT superfamily N-acetyltransferase